MGSVVLQYTYNLATPTPKSIFQCAAINTMLRYQKPGDVLLRNPLHQYYLATRENHNVTF